MSPMCERPSQSFVDFCSQRQNGLAGWVHGGGKKIYSLRHSKRLIGGGHSVLSRSVWSTLLFFSEVQSVWEDRPAAILVL